MDQKLERIRHSAAHLLAAAVLEIYPKAKPTIGPAIESGFYYDFDFGDVRVSESDLKMIEEKMTELLPNWKSFEVREVSAEEALAIYAENQFKKELVEEIVSKGEKITFYRSGDFEDLCRGGHALRPYKEIGAFKLLSVAGAYWRGDEKQLMLTRIYGTAFEKKSELEAYLAQIEEAKRRDHKKLGKDLDLFTFSELVGSGLPLWTPRGTLVRNLLDDFVWSLRRERGYQKVSIPHITKKELYITSGHWSKFSEELFKITTREGHEFAMKPMNCPHHTQIYAARARSYRDLPQRYCETTVCYRDEQSGELSGLSRVRSFAQDDAHVFCRYVQLSDEIQKIYDIVTKFYGTLGFELSVRLSKHDPHQMEKYLGTEETWCKAEEILQRFLVDNNRDYVDGVGEAAFYGPKIDFMSKDALGRTWQVATIQLDMNMPERFDLYCNNETGEKERIVMIHAAIMGSIERFLSVYIEHVGGAFPAWLAPVQVVVVPIADRHSEYAEEFVQLLLERDVRPELDGRAETMQSKVRDAETQKVPYILVVGDKEVESACVSVRKRGQGNLGIWESQRFLESIVSEIAEKR